MADPSQYLINPDTQEVVEVPSDWVDRARKRDYKPASEQQIKEFQAADYAKQHPVLSTLKTGALQAAEFVSPVGLTRTVLAAGAQPEAMTSAIAEQILPESLAKGFRAAKTFAELRGPSPEQAGLAAASDILAPLTPTGALVSSGLQSREQIAAEQEEAGLTGQILGMAGAVVGPAALSRLTLSGLAKRKAAQLAEERLVEATAKAGKLIETGAPEAAIAIKETEKAAAEMAKATDAAAARRAILSKVPGGEKVAQGVERALRLPEEQSALNLISEAVGRPVSRAAEASTRSLIESAPYLSQAPQAVKDIVAKGIATGAGSAADLALLNLGQVSQESVLGDHRVTAERVLAAMEHGAIDGFMFGATLGAIPPALSGVIDASGAALRAMDRTFNRYYPSLAAKITGANVESVEALRRSRGETANLGELIKQDLAARQPLPPEPAPFVPRVTPAPFEPQLAPVVGVEGIGMVPATSRMAEFKPSIEPEPLPYPVKPEPVGVTALPPDQVERAAQDFLSDLKGVDQSGNALMRELNKRLRPQEAKELFKTWHRQQGNRLIAEMKAELGGRMPTPADAEKFSRRVSDLDDAIYDEGMRLSNHIRGVVEGIKEQFPDAMPTATLRQMNILANKLEKASQRSKSVFDTYDSIASVKRQLFELAPDYKPGESQSEMLARKAANQAGSQFIESLKNPALWGDNAAREAAVNAMRTRFTAAQKNLKRFWGRKEDYGVDASTKVFSSGRVASFVSDPVSVKNADALNAYNEYRSALNDLHKEARESARYTADQTGVETVAESVADLAKSFTNVENNALRKMDIDFAVEQSKKSAAEYKKLKSEIDIENSRRQQSAAALEQKIKELDGERKVAAQAELQRIKAENEIASNNANKRLEQFEAQQKAAREEAKAKRSAWEEQLNQRQKAVDEQVKLLTKGKGTDPVTQAFMFYELIKNPIPVVTGAVLKSPVMTYKLLSRLESAAKATEGKARAVVDFLATGDSKAATLIGLPVAARNEKQEFELYRDRAKRLDAITNDPNEMASHLDRSVSEIDSHAPNIAGHSKSVTATAVSVLANSIPRPPPGLAPYDLLRWEPRIDQVREFNRRYEAVAQPLGVVSLIAQGRATKDQVQLLDTVYPALMEDIRTRLVDKLKDEPEISADRRRALSNLLNLNLDSTMKIGMSAQQVYGAGSVAPASKNKPIPVSRIKNMNVAGRSGQETAAWRAAQKGVGAWNRSNR